MPSPKRPKANQTPAAEYPTTVVHRCLFVSEILRHIFDFIWISDEDQRRGDADEDTDDSDVDVRQSNDGKKTLASLAGTCRSFSGVALDALWRVLNSLDPLLTICPKPKVRRFFTVFVSTKVRSV